MASPFAFVSSRLWGNECFNGEGMRLVTMIKTRYT